MASAENNADEDRLEWFCLKTKTKREHIAAAILENVQGVEVYCPRISQVRKTRAGKKRFTEALFPGYIFARFCFREKYRQVIHSQGVIRMVRQGERRAVPETIIRDLKASMPGGTIEAPDPSVEPGAHVAVVSGSLQGLDGKVLAQYPARNRVSILLHWLGREITVSVDADAILLARERS